MYIETNKKSMKRIIIIGSLVSCALLALTGEVQAQSGIEQVLKNIEANNKELQANAQLITSQKLEAKTDNNLPDPTLSTPTFGERKIKTKRSVNLWCHKVSTFRACMPPATS